jgi:hypothetical protein
MTTSPPAWRLLVERLVVSGIVGTGSAMGAGLGVLSRAAGIVSTAMSSRDVICLSGSPWSFSELSVDALEALAAAIAFSLAVVDAAGVVPAGAEGVRAAPAVDGFLAAPSYASSSDGKHGKTVARKPASPPFFFFF